MEQVYKKANKKIEERIEYSVPTLFQLEQEFDYWATKQTNAKIALQTTEAAAKVGLAGTSEQVAQLKREIAECQSHITKLQAEYKKLKR